MVETEGVIKFKLEHSPGAAFPWDTIRELNAWRKLLHVARLIGQTPGRYGGLAYGNISHRVPPFEGAPTTRRPFIISGTQTGGLVDLKAIHYTLVTACSSRENRIASEGPLPPSSEALTHGMIYDLDETSRWVIHVHSPEIWKHAKLLKLPVTDAGAEYGTPEMAREVEKLFQADRLKEQPLFVMGGHEDGVVSFGRSAEEAGLVLLKTLANALTL